MRAFIPLRSVLLLTALGASGLAAQPAATPGFTEPEIKAAFLTHLIGFVSWPGQQQAKTICVEQDDTTVQAVESILATRVDDGVELIILASAEELPSCDLLYMNSDTTEGVDGLFHRGVLTVADADGFAQQGGMIEFQRKANRIALIINTGAMYEAGLTASSRLLALATVIPTTGREM